MALQQNTKRIVEAAVTARDKYDRGNVWGKWQDARYYNGSQIGWMNYEFAQLLAKHNRNSKVFVLYSYHTPMAWYVEDENKWYFPMGKHAKYSRSTGWHQDLYRYSLKGATVVVLTSDDDGNVSENEQKYFDGKPVFE